MSMYLKIMIGEFENYWLEPQKQFFNRLKNTMK